MVDGIKVFQDSDFMWEGDHVSCMRLTISGNTNVGDIKFEEADLELEVLIPRY